MNPNMNAIRAGWSRGVVELRHAIENWTIMGYLWTSFLAVAVLYMLRNQSVPGTDFSLASSAMPGMIAMNLMLGGLSGIAMALVQDRGDGTLLRVKCIPKGFVGYVTAKVVSNALIAIVMFVIVLGAGMLMFGDLGPKSGEQWLRLVAMLVIGVFALMPMGAVLGSLVDKVQNLSMVTMVIMMLTMVSGIFYPIAALPTFLQWVGKAFPLYWLGLGLRSGLLPDEMKAVEPGDTWHTGLTFAILAAWMIAGLVIAPGMLRRVARNESGSRLEDRRRTSVSWGA